MERKEYIELLNELMTIEIENIRKIVKPYSRDKRVFNDEVVIDYKEDMEDTVGGTYHYDNDSFQHIIYINKKLVENYIEAKNNKPTNWIEKWMNKDAINQLKGVIGHELTHAYVNQRYGNFNKYIDGIHRDASPVFLATLSLFGYTSGHHCNSNFYDGELSNKVFKIRVNNTRSKWFEEFNDLIIDYIFSIRDFKETFNNRQLDMVKNKEVKDINKIINISFEFSPYGSGLKKYISCKSNTSALQDNKHISYSTESILFRIGSTMQNIDKIKELTNKKINNEICAELQHDTVMKFNNKNVVYNKETKNY